MFGGGGGFWRSPVRAGATDILAAAGRRLRGSPEVKVAGGAGRVAAEWPVRGASPTLTPLLGLVLRPNL